MDPQEVEDIIKDFDISKGVGLNSIAPKILKQISHLISKPLSEIFNKSFRTGIYPDLINI